MDKYMVKTRKNRKNNVNLINKFHREITTVFLQVLIMVKLFHWKTTSYATHKATDEFYEKLNTNMDSFIEILLGKTMSRIDLTREKTLRLIDLTNPLDLKNRLEQFKSYLINLDNNKAMLLMANTDLYNIRDTILGDVNQLLYLLTFK
jgi:hypothetical protein